VSSRWLPLKVGRPECVYRATAKATLWNAYAKDDQSASRLIAREEGKEEDGRDVAVPKDTCYMRITNSRQDSVDRSASRASHTPVLYTSRTRLSGEIHRPIAMGKV